MQLDSGFTGANAAYLEEQYERYLRDPASVTAELRAFFEQASAGGIPLPVPIPPASPATPLLPQVHDLAEAIRRYGHFAAQLDPLGSPPPGDPSLELATYGLTEAMLASQPASLVGGVQAEGAANALEAIRRLRSLYSARVGHDYLQIRTPAERNWLREAVESRRFEQTLPPADAEALLNRLTQVETFEHFLQRAFTAKTRFSIEGLDILVPMLDAILGMAANAGIRSALLGMAHRGRLNVLTHLLGTPYSQILAEFKDPLLRAMKENEPSGWTGDVKYHAGALTTLASNAERGLRLTLTPNPSHLEAVNPVILGMARAAGDVLSARGLPKFNPGVTLPILIHGDAAFPAQGVVSETLNLYSLPGYWTGGSLHIIANNQVGFTTDPLESRSTLFASDLAKGFRIPILHVNADDPEGCLMAVRLAFAFRQTFRRDFLIDLIGYRRYGHNEGDEPAFTQPAMYAQIAAHPTARQLWATELQTRAQVTPEHAQNLYDDAMRALQHTLETLNPEDLRLPVAKPAPSGAARHAETAVSLETLRALNAALIALPAGFSLHPRLARVRSKRPAQLDEPTWPSVDWSAAEELAFASLLAEGIAIRLTGQDAQRGTFSHRHAVLHDAVTGQTYTPLQSIPEARAAFAVYNSPLSEAAALGFEFGYDLQSAGRTPPCLVIWEAQYGDFINNAQTMVDEFIATARDKWGQRPGLVLLLPHGSEGQGPDHSSARPERFLNLAVDNNLRVANCTTAAQYFHLLRRQALLLQRDPLPLVVLTPKSLLRHPLVSSAPQEFSAGRFQPVMDRRAAPNSSLPDASGITHLVIGSGKVTIDLLTHPETVNHPEIAVIRLEQLAPFPMEELRAVLSRYPNAQRITWAQEEPENMGAWEAIRAHLQEAAGNLSVHCVARARSAAPAEGSATLHAYHQDALLRRVMG